jgi:FtsH-binding integral membrane protein
MVPLTASAKRVVSIGVVVALCATAGLAIAILLFSEFDRTQGRILGSTALIALAGLLVLPAGILFDQRRAVRLARAHVVLSVAGCTLALVAIWSDKPPDALGKAVATVIAFTLASTQAAALTARRTERDRPSVRRLYTISLALAAVAASMVAVAAWAQIDRELYFRVLGAVVVADALAVALQPILARTGRTRTVHRLRLLIEPGGERTVEVEASSFAAAAAKAIAAVERNGTRVRRIERVASRRDAGEDPRR